MRHWSASLTGCVVLSALCVADILCELTNACIIAVSYGLVHSGARKFHTRRLASCCHSNT